MGADCRLKNRGKVLLKAHIKNGGSKKWGSFVKGVLCQVKTEGKF